MAITKEDMILSCNVFEEEAKDIVAKPHYQRDTGTIGFLEALKSDRNVTGSRLQELVSRTWGKGDGSGLAAGATNRPKIQVTVPIAECGEVSDTRLNACSTTETFKNEKEAFTFTPDIVKSAQLFMTKEDLSMLCSESGNEFKTRQLIQKAGEILKAENEALLALAAPLMGDYAGAGEAKNSLTDPITLNLLNAGMTSINPTIEPLIESAYNSIGLSGAPIMVGGTLAGFAEKINARIVGANSQGVDTRFNGSFYFDKGMDTVYGDGNSHLITWAPTMLQSAEWFKHVGVQVDELDTMVRKVMEIPYAGRNWKFDYSMHYEECEQEYIITLTRQTGLLNIPNNSTCLIGDGLLHFLIACGAFDCSDLQPLLTGATVTP